MYILNHLKERVSGSFEILLYRVVPVCFCNNMDCSNINWNSKTVVGLFF
jgi:hypothetical protein